jgi:urease gamma subunit
MQLTPREFDKLIIYMMADVALKRKAKGLKLNYPEAVAIISAAALDGARAGSTLEEVTKDAGTTLAQATHPKLADGPPGNPTACDEFTVTNPLNRCRTGFPLQSFVAGTHPEADQQMRIRKAAQIQLFHQLPDGSRLMIGRDQFLYIDRRHHSLLAVDRSQP